MSTLHNHVHPPIQSPSNTHPRSRSPQSCTLVARSGCRLSHSSIPGSPVGGSRRHRHSPSHPSSSQSRPAGGSQCRARRQDASANRSCGGYTSVSTRSRLRADSLNHASSRATLHHFSSGRHDHDDYQGVRVVSPAEPSTNIRSSNIGHSPQTSDVDLNQYAPNSSLHTAGIPAMNSHSHDLQDKPLGAESRHLHSHFPIHPQGLDTGAPATNSHSHELQDKPLSTELPHLHSYFPTHPRRLDRHIGTPYTQHNLQTLSSSQIGPYISDHAMEMINGRKSDITSEILQENPAGVSSKSCFMTDQDHGSAHAFQVSLQDDVTSHLARGSLEGARAAQSTILAERRFIRRKVREGEIRMKLLYEEAEVVESRLTAAAHQLGTIRREIRNRGITVDEVESDLDSEDENLLTFHSLFQN